MMHQLQTNITWNHNTLTGFSLPQLRTKFGERALLHAGLSAWNSEHIRAEPDIRVFRKLLKTRLFNLAFNVPVYVKYSLVFSMWLFECIYVQRTKMHWMMMMMMRRVAFRATLYNLDIRVERYSILRESAL